MNKTLRFVIVGLLTLFAARWAVNAWASPKRQGTVPIPPSFALIGGENTFCSKVNMTNIIFTLLPSDEKSYVCAATNVTNPNSKEYGPAPQNTAFLGDVFKFIVTLDNIEVDEITIEICYAYPPEFEEKEAKIHRWDPDLREWGMVLDGGIVSGDPKQICATSTQTGIFSLIGKP